MSGRAIALVPEPTPGQLPAWARPAPVPFLPEVRLYQAAEGTELWDAVGGEYRSDRPPPFWAFAWPGGVALARYLLDHPELVAGRNVLDLAAGSGVVAIAAALAGACAVQVVDSDPDALTSAVANATANGVPVETRLADATDPAVLADLPDLLCVGDGFYTASGAGRLARLLRVAGTRGATVLVGDPDRQFLPRHMFARVAAYDVPVRPELEGVRIKPTTVWRLRQPRC